VEDVSLEKGRIERIKISEEGGLIKIHFSFGKFIYLFIYFFNQLLEGVHSGRKVYHSLSLQSILPHDYPEGVHSD
jgi:hypothetical protein